MHLMSPKKEEEEREDDEAFHVRSFAGPDCTCKYARTVFGPTAKGELVLALHPTLI